MTVIDEMRQYLPPYTFISNYHGSRFPVVQSIAAVVGRFTFTKRWKQPDSIFLGASLISKSTYFRNQVGNNCRDCRKTCGLQVHCFQSQMFLKMIQDLLTSQIRVLNSCVFCILFIYLLSHHASRYFCCFVCLTDFTGRPNMEQRRFPISSVGEKHEAWYSCPWWLHMFRGINYETSFVKPTEVSFPIPRCWYCRKVTNLSFTTVGIVMRRLIWFGLVFM